MVSSRRDFLRRLGESALAGGIFRETGARRRLNHGIFGAEADLPNRGHGAARKIVILGGGIAGLTCAYHLNRAGYRCLVLEARSRVGGRIWTIRGGDRIELTDGTEQLCRFADGLYFDAGAAHIPSHHTQTLKYCRDFGVQVETAVAANRSARLQSADFVDGRPLEVRRVLYDFRGWISEMLGRLVAAGAVPTPMEVSHRTQFLQILKKFGSLTPELKYKGSTQAGLGQPVPLETLVDNPFWTKIFFEDVIDQQPTMLQPVGGMDQLPKAMARRLANCIKTRCAVRAIKQAQGRVQISFQNLRTGRDDSISADLCISTLPLTVLKGVAADWDSSHHEAIAAAPTGDSCKVAFQSPRWWELEDQIYGGMSFVADDCNMVIYPSDRFHSAQGILIGCYNFEDQARRFGLRRIPAQIAAARAAVGRLHPGRATELSRGVAVRWAKVPFSLSPWTPWGQDGKKYRLALEKPDGSVYFAGEYLSRVGAWVEGAIESAHRTVAAIMSSETQERNGAIP